MSEPRLAGSVSFSVMTKGLANGTQRAIDLVRKGPYARLWWATAISSLGDWITLFATLELAGDLGGLGGTLAVLLARVIPGLIFGAVAGVLADRFDRKRVMIISDVGRGLLVLSLIFASNLTQVVVISLIMEILSMIRQPAREAVVPHLVRKDSLVKANSLSLVAAYGTMPFGALLLAVFGGAVTVFGLSSDIADPKLALAFVVDALTFFVSAAIVTSIPIPKPEVSESRKTRGGFDWRAPLRDIWEGIRFVAGQASIRGIILGMTTALFGAGALFIVGDQFAQRLRGGGESGFGIVLTALGFGAATGMILMSSLSRILLWRAVVFGLSLVLAGVATIAAAFTSTIWGASAWIFIGGVATGSAYVMGFTHIHETVTDELRGRTFAALFTLARTALLISLTLASAVAAALDGVFPEPFDSGVKNILILGGAIILLAGVFTLWTVRDQIATSGEGAIQQMGQQLMEDRRKAREVRRLQEERRRRQERRLAEQRAAEEARPTEEAP